MTDRVLLVDSDAFVLLSASGLLPELAVALGLDPLPFGVRRLIATLLSRSLGLCDIDLPLSRPIRQQKKKRR